MRGGLCAYRRSKGIQPSLRDHELDSPKNSDVAEQQLGEKKLLNENIEMKLIVYLHLETLL